MEVMMNYVWMPSKIRSIIAGILACVLLAIAGIVMHYHMPYTFTVPELPILTIQEQQNSFNQKLEQTAAENAKALARIKSDFHITDQQWKLMHRQLAMLKKQDNLLSHDATNYQTDHPFEQMVAGIACDYGMNPSAIHFNFVKNGKIDIQTRQPIIDGKVIHLLEVDLDWISKYPIITQESFIRHELMHFYNYDSAANNVLYQLLEDAGHSSHDFLNHPAIVHLNHTMELRADLLACCQSSEAAYALKYDLDRDAAHILGQWTSKTHPSPEIRSAQLKQLLQEMHANMPKLA